MALRARVRVFVCLCVSMFWEAAREKWRAGAEAWSMPVNYYIATVPLITCISLETKGATRDGLLDPVPS